MSADLNKRDAHPSSRAYDYQKLRVLKLLIENLSDEDACATIEYVDDVFLQTSSDQGHTQHIEQVKNYEAEDSALSINSLAVRGSICNFLEVWLDLNKSSHLRFCLCTTAQIAKERLTPVFEKANISLPDEAVLECIKKKKYSDVIEVIKFVVTKEFSEDEGRKEYRARVNKLTTPEWSKFISQIVVEDDCAFYEELVGDVLNLLKNLDYIKSDYQISQERLFEILIGYINLKLVKGNFLARLIKVNDIKLKILEEIKGVNKTIDPAGEVPIASTDVRSLREKIVAVCTDYKDRNINTLERRSAFFMSEERRLADNPAFKALKVRIYDKCDEVLSEHISLHGNKAMTKLEIDNMILKLKNEAQMRLTQLSQNYDYPLTNEVSIEGLILNLFDSCFLAFDEV